MRHNTIIRILILTCLFVVIMIGIVSADTLHSDWIGTLDKSYELAWQQKSSGTYNGYRTYFFLEYTYLMNGTKKYPTYCIEYYKKGPRGNNDYRKTKLIDTDMNKEVRNGLIEIMKQGYPNVSRPYGTKDVSEAYYATSAAIHVWTMYHGVDNVAGKNLGWFMFKDGLRMDKNSLVKYISDYSTESTASGWHIMGPNNNDSSKRTWKAAMELLIDATEANVQEPYINLKKYKDSYFYQNYIVYEYIIESNYCTGFGVKTEKNISGCKIEYSEEKNNSVVAKIYIPVSSVNSGDKYNIYAFGSLIGADDVNNYYYLYQTKGEYQTMVYLINDNARTINSKTATIDIPNLNYRTYYDLNYSGVNYIKGGDFNNINILSYRGDKSFSTKGNVNFSTHIIEDSSYKRLHVNFSGTGKENCLRVSTLLNGSSSDMFKEVTDEILTFSCRVKSSVKTSLKLSFNNSKTIYEKIINEAGKWIEISITIKKSDYEDNILCLFTDNVCEMDFITMQLESGNKLSSYISENSNISEPMYTEHKMGSLYSNLYNGSVPEREYYVFVGWNTKKDGTGIFVNSSDTVNKGHQILYAIWTTKKTYNIYFHYNANGGNYLIKNDLYNASSLGYNKVTVPNNTEYIIQYEAYRSGYDFIGWSIENNLDSVAEEKTVDSVYINGADIHLYPNFKKTHKVRFHYYDDASGTEQSVSTVEQYSYNIYPYIGVVILPDTKKSYSQLKIPEVDGYKLKGWTTNKEEIAEIDYKCGDTEDVVLYDDYYAIYENDITVKFYDNIYDSDHTDGHSGSSYLHKNYNLEVTMNYKGTIKYAEFKLPDDICEVKGYDFYGWSDSRLFNGSICFFASEKGITVQTDTDLKFYSLYADKKTVRFYDYDFTKDSQHLEKEIYAYEYMNYNGDTYKPEILIQSPCMAGNGWIFDGWTVLFDSPDSTKYYPEEKYSVDNDVSFYANYKNGISVNCHYLTNDTDNTIVEKVEEVLISETMNSEGHIEIKPIILPDIPEFQDEKKWSAMGYSDIDNASDVVTHKENEEYFFYDDCHLYAIYKSDIVVNYHDYSINEDTPLLRTDNHKLIKTCDNRLTGVKLIFPDKLTPDVHDKFWWTDSDSDKSSDMHYPSEAIIVYSDSDFYAWHSDKYKLICNDLLNNEIRNRVFEASAITSYKGSVTPGRIMIPLQGMDNTIEATGYWSLSTDIVADYWSEEYINLYSDIEINAIYQKTVNVIYDANGGLFDGGNSELTETKYVFYNVTGSKIVPSFTPEYEPYRNGFIFNNIWNTSSDGSGNEYVNGVSFKNENDIRLFASWKIADSPFLSVIDRYFFVGDEITYNDIIEKIIAKDEFGLTAIDNVKITSINNRRVDGLSNDEIANKIVANYARMYKVDVRFTCSGNVINNSYDIYIVDKEEECNKLRYISAEYMDTLESDSKWNYGFVLGKLVVSLNKNKEDAEYMYVITKEGVD